MHKGRQVEDVVRRSGLTITAIAKKMELSRRTLYQWFTDPDLAASKVLRIGYVLSHDFTTEIPELKEQSRSRPQQGIGLDSRRLLHERDKYLGMYQELAQQQVRMMERIMNFEERLIELLERIVSKE